MSHRDLDVRVPAHSNLAALAEQLRDGPLQELMELQLRAAELARRPSGTPGHRLEDVADLVQLSISVMEHFHAFTREFQDALRDLTDVPSPKH